MRQFSQVLKQKNVEEMYGVKISNTEILHNNNNEIDVHMELNLCSQNFPSYVTTCHRKRVQDSVCQFFHSTTGFDQTRCRTHSNVVWVRNSDNRSVSSDQQPKQKSNKTDHTTNIHTCQFFSNNMASQVAHNIIVGGGSGFVGQAIVHSLLKKGYQVTVITRSVQQALKHQQQQQQSRHHTSINLSPQIQSGQLSFATWSDLKLLNKPISAGINVTGQSVFDSRWTDHFVSKLYSSRLNPTRDMIQFLAAQDSVGANVEKPVFVGTSAVGIFPVDEPNTVFSDLSDESNDTTLLTRNGVARNSAQELCLSIEENIEEENANTGHALNCSVLRPGAVLGKDGAVIQQMALPFYFGFTFYANGGQQPFPYVHVHDLAELYIHVMESNLSGKSELLGAVNGVAPQLTTARDFSQSLAQHMHRSFMPLVPVPSGLLNLTLGPDRALFLTHGQKVSPDKALQTGFQFKYPTVEKALGEICPQLKLTELLAHQLSQLTKRP